MASEGKLKAGSIDDFADSMAEAMEKAFIDLWPKIMNTEGEEDPEKRIPVITNHFRMIFVAVAQGVVQHLVDHADAFKVTVNKEEPAPAEEEEPEVSAEEEMEEDVRLNLHKHMMGLPISTVDSEVLNNDDLSVPYGNIDNFYLNHRHTIEETDTHDHSAFITVEPDDSLLLIVSAGSDEEIAADDVLNLQSSNTPPFASNYSSLSWETSGTGTFNNDTLLRPTYTPDPDDVTAGGVTLTLTAQPNEAGNEISDSMTLTFNPT